MERSLLRPVVGKKVYMAQNADMSGNESFRVLEMSELVEYHPLCDDFGPVRLCEVVRFIEIVEDEISEYPDHKIAIKVDDGDKRQFSNAVFLLGAYMVLSEELSSEQILQCFSWVDKSYAEPFRDASYIKSDFGLTLGDCWRALERAVSRGWFGPPSKPGVWGRYNIDEYEHYDNPANGDIHIVVPGKFVAFKGPKDLGGREYLDDSRGYREFSPQYYVQIFNAMDVTSVVRLNEPHYSRKAFSDNGINHFDLEFEDCTAPPEKIVRNFLHICDSNRGLVAVHCKAGLGRTGTLIARYMMRSCGFTAREAIAWLRLVRPGSVIGAQQHYLCRVERGIESDASSERCAASQGGQDSGPSVARAAAVRRSSLSSTFSGRTVTGPVSAALLPPASPPHRASGASGRSAAMPSGPAAGSSSAPLASEVARQVAEGMERRAASRMRSGSVCTSASFRM